MSKSAAHGGGRAAPRRPAGRRYTTAVEDRPRRIVLRRGRAVSGLPRRPASTEMWPRSPRGACHTRPAGSRQRVRHKERLGKFSWQLRQGVIRQRSWRAPTSWATGHRGHARPPCHFCVMRNPVVVTDRNRSACSQRDVRHSSAMVAVLRGIRQRSTAAVRHAAARSSSSSRSRALRVSDAARSKSTRASPPQPSLASKSPRTLGNRW